MKRWLVCMVFIIVALTSAFSGGNRAEAASSNAYQKDATPAVEPVQFSRKAIVELMERWNQVARGRTAPGFECEVDFMWENYDFFPHPVRLSLAPEAYTIFTQIMLDFLSRKDNLKFIQENNFSELPIHYTVAVGTHDFGTLLSVIKWAADSKLGVKGKESLGLQLLPFYKELDRNSLLHPSSNLNNNIVTASTLKQPDRRAITELLERWNEVAKGKTVSGFGNFLWPQFDQFPHPTFRGGSYEAYTVFAEILLDFLSRKDNMKFIRENNLSTIPIYYVLLGGQRSDFGKLENLVKSFAKSRMLGSNESLRQRLMVQYEELIRK